MGNLDVSKLTKGDPFKIPAWQKVLKANDPQYFTKASPAPLLMIQGGNDEQIPRGVDADPRASTCAGSARTSSGGSIPARATRA